MQGIHEDTFENCRGILYQRKKHLTDEAWRYHKETSLTLTTQKVARGLSKEIRTLFE